MMRILIADDNADAALSLALLVQEWGFDAIEVHDGLSALALLRGAEAPTFALLDWMMPGMNGIEICRELRKASGYPYTYVILLTGQGDKKHMLDGLNAGADDYLVKPADPNELRARLATGQRILDLQDQLLTTQRQLREQATRDSLTGLWNRAMILDILHRELARSQRKGQPVTVLMADIDHFKSINDTYGHLVGDHVLRQTAQRLLTVLRPYDTVGRYGGEEFVVVLGACELDHSLALAERLRICVETEPIPGGGVAVPVTLSLGVATWDGEASVEELLRTADNALYQAKRQGRNRVVSAQVTAKQGAM